MTAEERKARIHELNEQSIKIRNELNALQKEDQYQEQQDCLRFVGKAFKSAKNAILVTSVPPIEMRMIGEHLNPYQFPCIIIDLRTDAPPVFDETSFIKGGIFYGKGHDGAYQEIPCTEFKEFLDKRMEDIFNKAMTAKGRQQGKKVFTFGDGEICEK